MKLVIADDHAPVRQALRSMLELDLGVEVLAETADGAEAVDLVRDLGACTVLMDVQMPGMDGVEATRRILRDNGAVRVVALTSSKDPVSVASMIAAGADSYLVKTAAPDDLRESLRSIVAGQVALSPEVVPFVVSELATRLRTEQRRADALEELDRTKREFVALVADQLTTPLTAISGYVKTLRSGWPRLTEEMKLEFLERIDQQGERLGRRLRQILTVAQLQTGQGGSSGPPFSMAGLVHDLPEHLESDWRGRVEFGQLAAGEVAGDHRALASVALALVENALLHTSGTARVSVRREDDCLVLVVDDDGPGVDPDLLDASLEELFSPGDASDTRETAGLGLSLYIARRVVEGAGGRLALDSGTGRGTRVLMSLPEVR